MLKGLVLTVHILNCIILIIVVLLQAGKGSTVGLAIGGGASQTVFGSSGGKNFFARMTSVMAVIFMATSVLLTVISSQHSRSYRGLMNQIPGGTSAAIPASEPESSAPAAPASLPIGK